MKNWSRRSFTTSCMRWMLTKQAVKTTVPFLWLHFSTKKAFRPNTSTRRMPDFWSPTTQETHGYYLSHTRTFTHYGIQKKSSFSLDSSVTRKKANCWLSREADRTSLAQSSRTGSKPACMKISRTLMPFMLQTRKWSNIRKKSNNWLIVKCVNYPTADFPYSMTKLYNRPSAPESRLLSKIPIIHQLQAQASRERSLKTSRLFPVLPARLDSWASTSANTWWTAKSDSDAECCRYSKISTWTSNTCHPVSTICRLSCAPIRWRCSRNKSCFTAWRTNWKRTMCT